MKKTTTRHHSPATNHHLSFSSYVRQTSSQRTRTDSRPSSTSSKPTNHHSQPKHLQTSLRSPIFTTKSMSNKSPIFPIPEPQHFSDYGFEPQIDYFQVLEEARKHKREAASRSIDLQFKLQKPISKDESSKKIKKSKKRWWRNPLLFFKFPKRTPPAGGATSDLGSRHHHHHQNRIGSISGPIYITESRSGSSTPYRTSSRQGSGPLVKGEVDIPYFSLRELNTAGSHRVSAAETPIYLVT